MKVGDTVKNKRGEEFEIVNILDGVTYSIRTEKVNTQAMYTYTKEGYYNTDNIGSDDDLVIDEQVVDEQVVAFAEEQVVDEQVVDEQVVDEQVVDEQVVDEQVVAFAEEQVVDEKLGYTSSFELDRISADLVRFEAARYQQSLYDLLGHYLSQKKDITLVSKLLKESTVLIKRLEELE